MQLAAYAALREGKHMQAVILCGGKGLRLSRIMASQPKPLADLNGKPLLWHIMNHFSKYGVRDFILPLGYKGEMIRDYFNNYNVYQLDYKLSLSDNQIEYLNDFPCDWNITFVDTGVETQTGGRVKMIEKYITEDNFFVTYGDCVGNVNIGALLEYHKSMNRLATVTGIDYRSQYGVLGVKNGAATTFKEKPLLSLIVNAGFFVFSKGALQYLPDDKRASLETSLLKKLTAIDELSVYKHDGFWIGIDSYKDLLTAQQNFNRLTSTPAQ